MFEGFAIVVVVPIAMLVGYCIGVPEGKKQEAAERELEEMTNAVKRDTEVAWH